MSAREHEGEVFAAVAALRHRRAAERARRPEQARIEKLEQTPELADVILDRRAAEGQPMAPAQQPGRLRRCARGVLDRLRFVEDDVIELLLGQPRRHPACSVP